jgi:hypothetical protein
MEEIYKEVALMYIRSLKVPHTHTGRKEIVAEIENLNIKLSKARDMVFDEKLDTDDF